MTTSTLTVQTFSGNENMIKRETFLAKNEVEDEEDDTLSFT